jgi:electron-transferring-flavoprotein dehydrogenase
MNRETLEVDVLTSVAARLVGWRRRVCRSPAARGEPLSIAVLEKAREAGAHILSGAVLDPSTLRDLIPDFAAKGAPLASPVERDSVYFLTEKSKIRFPIVPPPLRNHGNFIVSLNELVRCSRRSRPRARLFTGLRDRKS